MCMYIAVRTRTHTSAVSPDVTGTASNQPPETHRVHTDHAWMACSTQSVGGMRVSDHSHLPSRSVHGSEHLVWVVSAKQYWDRPAPTAPRPANNEQPCRTHSSDTSECSSREPRADCLASGCLGFRPAVSLWPGRPLTWDGVGDEAVEPRRLLIVFSNCCSTAQIPSTQHRRLSKLTPQHLFDRSRPDPTTSTGTNPSQMTSNPNQPPPSPAAYPALGTPLRLLYIHTRLHTPLRLSTPSNPLHRSCGDQHRSLPTAHPALAQKPKITPSPSH